MRPARHLRPEWLRLEPSQQWIDTSNTWRFFRICQGDGYYLHPVKPRALTLGEIIVAAPQVAVTLHASQLGPLTLAGFRFDPSLLCGFLTLAERQELETEGEQGGGSVHVLTSSHPVSVAFEGLLERQVTIPEFLQRAELLALAARLISFQLPVDKRAGAPGLSALDQFRRIMTRMPESELLQHSTKDLAGLCGCTPRHFTRLFRQCFGESPRARQTELRLLKARALLESSDDSISRVANECGYRSLSLFNSLFKRRFGITPSDWKHAHNPYC